MRSIHLSGLFVRPLAQRIAGWLEAGKLDEEDLDRALTPNARSLVDLSSVFTDWVPLEDAETLVTLVADQLGGEAGLVEAAGDFVEAWLRDALVVTLLDDAHRLVDGTGYVLTQTSERLLRRIEFRYEGGRERFCVRLLGLSAASSDLKALLGALLARLAEKLEGGFGDVRVDGVDSGELLIFAQRRTFDALDASGESRLHRAALIA
jgi:hypothetical protein